jgi:hypothetical protein
MAAVKLSCTYLLVNHDTALPRGCHSAPFPEVNADVFSHDADLPQMGGRRLFGNSPTRTTRSSVKPGDGLARPTTPVIIPPRSTPLRQGVERHPHGVAAATVSR